MFNTEKIKTHNFFKVYAIFYAPVISWYLTFFVIFEMVYTAAPYVTSNDRR